MHLVKVFFILPSSLQSLHNVQYYSQGRKDKLCALKDQGTANPAHHSADFKPSTQRGKGPSLPHSHTGSTTQGSGLWTGQESPQSNPVCALRVETPGRCMGEETGRGPGGHGQLGPTSSGPVSVLPEDVDSVLTGLLGQPGTDCVWTRVSLLWAGPGSTAGSHGHCSPVSNQLSERWAPDGPAAKGESHLLCLGGTGRVTRS